MGRPASVTVPDVGCCRPATIDSNVLFPHPDAPTIVTNSPSPIVTSTPSRASTDPLRELKRFDSPRIWMVLTGSLAGSSLVHLLVAEHAPADGAQALVGDQPDDAE